MSNPKAYQTEFELPDGGKCILRPVTPDDETLLVAIYTSTREDELAQAEWADGQKEKFLQSQFELQRREYDARFPDADYFMIMVDGEPAGRFWTGSDENQIRLLDIAILPPFQNRGVGTLLLRRLMEDARATSKALRHMVFVLNPDAHRFYERLGFTVIEDFGAYKHMEWLPPGVTA